jgi:2-polyprenyl-3-methyl-5-hydroxy-6-metoxy-1,4-benzoquinol methylase
MSTMTVPFALPGRRHVDELMDGPAVTFDDYRACLADLARVNRLSLGYRPTLAFLDRVAAGMDRLMILDVASGHGDMLRAIHRWAERRGLVVELTGLDLNPKAAAVAGEATPRAMAIRYETGDVFALDPGRRFDVVVSSLFTHHLTDADLLAFVGLMERTARVGWFVNDLHRHPLPDLFLRLAMPMARLHPMVVHDGPVSVRRAFVREDWERLLDAAGIAPERREIAWWTPFRWGVAVRTGGTW